MKRPITILCITNLHLQGDPNEQSSAKTVTDGPLELLRDNLFHFQDDRSDQNKWAPDFLLIAGDLVDKCTRSNYKYVQRQIDALITLFNIKPFRVILTPGNHDRKTYSPQSPCRKQALINKYDATEQHFAEICKSGQVLSVDLKKRFIKDHVSAFRQFTDLYKSYLQPSDDSEKFQCWPDLFEGVPEQMQDLQYTSGLKIFEKEKVCFLSVNTEWLYTRRSIRSADKQKIGPCRPFVNWAFNEIRKSYSDYTVITVMHRDPRSLSWDEKNISDSASIDTISVLENYSDIIVSGHDHTLKINPPTMLRNHAQHFGIGSASRPAGINENVRYTASLLHINPIKGEMQVAAYDRWEERTLWQFVDIGTFPLQPKYSSLEKTGNIKQDLDMPIVKIRAKGANDDDIERAIRGYLRWNATDKQFGLLFMKDNVLLEPVGFDTAEQKIRKGLEQHDRIFFFRWQLAQKLSIKQTLENDPLERLKKCFRQEVLNMSLIIADIVIDIPIIALTQELLS